MADKQIDPTDADRQSYRLRSRTIATGNAPSPSHAEITTREQEEHPVVNGIWRSQRLARK